MQQGLMGQMIFIVVMIALFYVVVFLPEKKRRKKYNQMMDSLNLNDEIITRGGIVGTIINIKDDLVVIQTGPDRVRIQVSKNGIYNVTKKREESLTKKK